MHRPRPLRFAAPALFILLVALAPPVAALKDDDQQPLLIEADAAELDDQQSISLYLGNVDVRQGSMHILADEVLVQHRPDRQIQRIVAVGNPVRYQQLLDGNPEPVHGEALRAEYDTERTELILIDQAVLIQGEDRFASDRIVYNRTTARVTAGGSAQGRERVRIQLDPKESKSPTQATAPAAPPPIRQAPATPAAAAGTAPQAQPGAFALPTPAQSRPQPAAAPKPQPQPSPFLDQP